MNLRGLAIAAALPIGLVAGDALGAPPPAASTPPPPPSRVTIDATPVFGADAAAGQGWIEIVARVDNAGPTPARGSMLLTAEHPGYSYGGIGPDRFATKAPFQVPARSSAIVHLPMPVGRMVPSIKLTASAEDGASIAETSLSFSSTDAPLLVDVDQPSRLAPVMRAWPMTLAWSPGHPYAPTPTTTPLTVGVPAVDPTTGDPVLPVRSAAYSAVTVVLVPSERLAHLQGEPLEALVGWVLSGGTLAVVPTRPEDLRAGILATLVGGAIAPAAAPPVMMTLPPATKSASSPGGAPGSMAPGSPPWMPDPSETEEGGATPIGFFVPVRTTPLGKAKGPGPSAALRPLLTGYSGGNLRPTEYGATASYGLGQVHVLGFDPTTAPAIEDGWTHGRLLDMIADAWDRRALVAFPQGAGGDRASSPFEVHRALDPNQNFRPALGIAALLLVVYSVLSGPVLFARARKRGRPLDPLVWAPVASGVCFAAVVLVGLASKGWSGRARHLALVEAGAGMSRGTEHAFRGFFASQTRAMRVRASEPASVLELMSTDSNDHRQPVLSLEKESAVLENMTSLPWQTVVVSEDGFDDLGAGIAMHQRSDGSVAVTNHTGKRLLDVVVWAPETDASWFASIDDGATVVSTGGRTLFKPGSRELVTSGLRTVHRLDSSMLRTILGSKVADDMTAAWSAMAAAGGPSVDWWPDGVPVVMGEVAGGRGAKGDSGLRVESDRLMFRVLGEGGAP
jgi:hypothetical protein